MSLGRDPGHEDSDALSGGPGGADAAVHRLFLTGASGFLGQGVCKHLVARGLDVHASYHGRNPAEGEGVTWHGLDLRDEQAVRRAVEAVEPDSLVHLAWNVGDDYQNSAENDEWVRWSLVLANEVVRVGGRHLLMAGSCAEYEWAISPLGEDSPCRPATLYGAAKLSLYRQLHRLGGDEGVRVVWPRLFFLFGEDERPGRVIPHLINDVLEQRTVDWISPDTRRDYLPVEEASAAIVHLLCSPAAGVVNVASGEAPTVRELIAVVAAALALPPSPVVAQPPRPPVEVRADVGKLHELGWSASRSVADALAAVSRAAAPHQ